MTKYICTECTGRSGEEHTFEVSGRPEYCPWCGKRNLKTIESYLRDKIQDLQFELEQCRDNG